MLCRDLDKYLQSLVSLPKPKLLRLKEEALRMEKELEEKDSLIEKSKRLLLESKESLTKDVQKKKEELYPE